VQPDLQLWGLLITAGEQQRLVNEARMGKWHTIASTLKSKGHAHAVFHSRFVSRPLPFVNSNQQSPKVVDLAAQKFYWRFTRPFFSLPPHNKKKSGLARD